jgi:hypothetical protein
MQQIEMDIWERMPENPRKRWIYAGICGIIVVEQKVWRGSSYTYSNGGYV